jgi:branched-chain amino acid transport system permease protein
MNELLQQIVNGVAWGSLYALIALGYTMVYGVLRLINFAHGDVYMIGAMVAFYAARAWLGADTPSVLALFGVLALSMVTCGALGFVIERFAYRPLRQAPKLTALITAIGVSLLLENGGQLVFGADPKFFPTLIQTRELWAASGIVMTNVQALILGIALGLMLALQFFIYRTRFGVAIRAVSYSPEAAALMGIIVDRIISLTFVIGSMLAGAAGVLVGISNPKIDPLMGIMPGLKAFVAAVVGGIGNIPGAMAGGILMGLSEVLVVGYVSSTYRDAIAFVILILVLLLRPSGLFGASVEEKV